MDFFNKILLSTGSSASGFLLDGTVKNADTVDFFHLNQNVLTTSTPTFGGIVTTGDMRTSGNIFSAGRLTLSGNITASGMTLS
jgi:hypothetical protein